MSKSKIDVNSKLMNQAQSITEKLKQSNQNQKIDQQQAIPQPIPERPAAISTPPAPPVPPAPIYAEREERISIILPGELKWDLDDIVKAKQREARRRGIKGNITVSSVVRELIRDYVSMNKYDI